MLFLSFERALRLNLIFYQVTVIKVEITCGTLLCSFLRIHFGKVSILPFLSRLFEKLMEFQQRCTLQRPYPHNFFPGKHHFTQLFSRQFAHLDSYFTDK